MKNINFILLFLLFSTINVISFDGIYGDQHAVSDTIVNGYSEYCKTLLPITINAEIENFTDEEKTPFETLKSTLRYDGTNIYLKTINSSEKISTFEDICAVDNDICLRSLPNDDYSNYVLIGYRSSTHYPSANSFLASFSPLFGYFPDMSTKAKDSISLVDVMKRMNVVNVKDNVISGFIDNYRVNITFYENSACPKSVAFDIVNRLTPDESHEVLSVHYEVISYDSIDNNQHYIFPTEFITTTVISGGTIKVDPKIEALLKNEGKEIPSFNTEEYVVRSKCVIASFKNIQLTDRDFAFQSNFKNGTIVTYKDVPQIEYIWMDGKIVPKTDERMLAIAQGGHKFIPGPKESRFWLILLGIVGILVGGGWKLYDFWTSDRETASPKPEDQAT